MNRRWLAIVSGLAVCSSISATVWSQTVTRQPTLAERMAALRRGWSSGDRQPAATQQSPSTTRTPSGQTAPAQSPSRSFLPNRLLNRSSSQQSTERTSASTGMNAAAQTASRPRAGSVQANPANQTFREGFTLPGLGGSPLPSSQPRHDSNAAGNAIARELASDYPVIQPESSAATESHDSSTPTRTAQVDRPVARRSPSRRAPMHVGPNDLQRELVGAFPTAPTGKPADASTTPDNDSPTTEQLPTASAVPLALPATEEPTPPASSDSDWNFDTAGSTSSTNQATTDSAATPQLKIIDSAPDAIPTANSSTSRSIDLRPAFGRNLPAASGRTPITPIEDRHREAFGDTAESASADSGLLDSQQTPNITTDIRGPRQILVGREATYRVQLDNKGDAPAEGIVASIRIPSWADVIDTTTSHGTIQQSPGGGTTGLLEWQIVRLDAQSSETLDIQLVPRASRPLELAVSYTVAPVGSRAVVEVQEPKLGIQVAGPEEVLFGKPQLFRLTIINPGTGIAENVKIDLLPPGGGEAAVSSHPLGDLPAGTSKTVEVELTAREPGKLSVKAHATAEGGLACDADKEIFCRKPELQVDWRGPEEKYAGTQATYFFRVRNPGTAPAEDVTVRVSLPEGAEYTGASEGQSLDAQRREISWRVGTLGPGDDNYMELKCLMQTPGANQLKISAATASGDLSDSKLAETKVVALADLKLEVSDPSGPVAVGDEAVYEIRVTNRGASAAKDVNIVALFSDGIEPDQVEGALYSVADGRVSFRTIEMLPAGRQLALRIRAHAVQPGTHVFRAEVLCRDLEIKLAAEETTRFYADDLPAEGATPDEQAAERSQQFNDTTVR